MQKIIHIDLETRSSVDIKASGAHKYFECPEFEILLIAVAYGDMHPEVIDLTDIGPETDKQVEHLLKALKDPTVTKMAHNAAFERGAIRAHFGVEVPAEQWRCTAVHAYACGLPGSLGPLTKALGFGAEKAKQAVGTDLIRLFSVPQTSGKYKDQRWVEPWDEPEKWEQFKEYCAMDVVAEMAVCEELIDYPLLDSEWEVYAVDQAINDRGVLLDMGIVKTAARLAREQKTKIMAELRDLTGLENPNSAEQLKGWLTEKLGKNVTTIAKDNVKALLTEASGDVKQVLKLRSRSSLSSVAKYTSAARRVCADGTVKGSLQFNGASRTGRWAGRGVQVQNMPRNGIELLHEAREDLLTGDAELLEMVYGSVNHLLRELTRTMFIARPGNLLAIADYSSIEARLTAWYAREDWRIDVFNGHGKIYEASAAGIYRIPIEEVTSDQRQTGKVAELALGYGGSVGALKQFGADKMGFDDYELAEIVNAWRKANPNVVKFWYKLEEACLLAMTHNKVVRFRGLVIRKRPKALEITLPSGRSLLYQNAVLADGKFGRPEIRYQEWGAGGWGWTNTYGGKLTENVVQATAADLMRDALIKCEYGGIPVVMHIHDELVADVPEVVAEASLNRMIGIMRDAPAWAEGVPLDADGFTQKFYSKEID